jgi:hypothetical protein
LVDFKKEGYEGIQVPITLEPRFVAGPQVELTPTLATRREFGMQLYSRMVEALGGEDGLATANVVVGSGEVSLFDANGNSYFDGKVDWKLDLPEGIEMVFAGASRSFSVALRPTKAPQMKKNPPQGVEKLVRLFRDFQLAAVISRTKGSGMRFLAMSLESLNSEPLILEADDSVEKYVISLGPELVPVEIRHEYANVVDSHVSYADYRGLEKSRFPTKVLIRSNPSTREGAVFTLTEVETTRLKK